MRYFCAPVATLNAIRANLMAELEQPNGRAAEPWNLDGDFNAEGVAYVVLGDHHTTGDFADFVDEFITTPGVEEITDAAYHAALAQINVLPE